MDDMVDTHGMDEGSGKGVGMHSHGWMVWATHALDKGMHEGIGLGMDVDESMQLSMDGMGATQLG